MIKAYQNSRYSAGSRKEWNVMNETLRVLKERRSIRKYKAEQIKPAELDAILEAGTWAPTGMGKQSPVMVVVQDAETLSVLSKANAEIMGKPDIDPFYGAPTAVVVLADGENPNWLKDGSLVMGNLMNAAWSLNVGSCWINRATEYFDQSAGKEMLKKWNLPETLKGVGICVLGYIDGPIPAPKPRKEGYIVRV
jgi:nitroreductase